MNVSAHCFATLMMAAALFTSAEAAAPANGDVVDQLNGIPVYFNSPISHSNGKSFTADGYYLGLRYQCVEFVKRYYYQRFGHRMPNARGNALEYFDAGTADGALNARRGLLQYRNGSPEGPQPEDILVFGARPGNPYGHVAIVSAVQPDSLEIIQQNPGPSGRSRMVLGLSRLASGVTVRNPRVLGWLRLPGRPPPARPAESTPGPAPEDPSGASGVPSAKSP